MWVIIVILLCASGSKAEDVCENDAFDMCSKYQPTEVPENVEELKECLHSMLKFYECLKDYEDSCPEIVLQEGEYDSIRSVITDISTEGTHLNSIVTANFQCLLDAIRNRVINYQTRRAIITAFREYENVSYVNEEISEKDASDQTQWDRNMLKKEMCLFWFDDMGSIVNSITTQCGEAVEDAVIEIIHRSYYLNKGCSAQDVLELRNILEELNLDQSNKASLRESFRLLGKSE
ncbi:hypothetical protein JTE90_021079 [Oedothorax gibbosus]|uniref:Secreted protein n=1 Tax=Oedothorax gibbosus TaxID=931172 RepID=A0AAV6VR03_9ARAC|nr:hypothetical protein JTE90_021079 [Oedothorax gibbosus]